ncbi:MAG TPA: hypothetical protein P5277_01685 [Candidatus Paceibacterota bacterium]|nr:hypothetical protein [Candidatus Paceibacterota bacterium]
MTEKSEKEKLIEEIEELKSKIKNTEYDLANMFKGNSFIEQKLVISKETLEKKKKLLEELNSSNSKEKEQKIKKQEEEITEKDNNYISKDQEDIIKNQIRELE